MPHPHPPPSSSSTHNIEPSDLNAPSSSSSSRARRSRVRLLVGFSLSLLVIFVTLLVASSSSSPRHHDELFRIPSKDRRLASSVKGSFNYESPSTSLGGVGSAEASDKSSAWWRQLVSPSSTSASPSLSPSRSSRYWRGYRARVHESIDALGTSLTSLFLADGRGAAAIDFDLNDDNHLDDLAVSYNMNNLVDGAWSTWSESSILVEATQAMYASRPSSFGPHILLEPIQSYLYPITVFADTDMRACNLSSFSESGHRLPSPPRQGWIALVERGGCFFSQKVRFAQERNAVAVVFGDKEDGVSGIGGLLTPGSPDDTRDIRIPSTFVSRASYLSLLRSWHDVQDKHSPNDPKGLLVTLSKDELFAWPLLDLLVLILFLPSLLTLLTVFTQRIRMIRQRRLDRAPRDAVAKLPVFLWGDTEKAQDETTTVASRDEEQAIGSSTSAATYPTSPSTESTPLLTRSTTSIPRARGAAYLQYLPSFITRRSHPPTSNEATTLARRRKHRTFVASNECSICLSDFEKGEWVMELPCGHLFHKVEIEPWLLESKRVCPVCRASITTESSEDEEASIGSPVLAPAPAPAPVRLIVAVSPPSTPDPLTPNEPSSATTAPLPLVVPPPSDHALNIAASPVASSSSVTLEDSDQPAGRS